MTEERPDDAAEARKTGEGDVAAAASSFWDSRVGDGESAYWTAHPLIRDHVHEQVSGFSWLRPLAALKVGWAQKRLPRGLSLGCGSGGLERNAYQLALCDRIDAFDVSPRSIRAARRGARKEGVRGVSYRVADCERIRLPRNRYDIVFFHQSLHHIADPDRLLAEVERSLVPEGLLYVDEFVGPSRDEWADEERAAEWLGPAREAWASAPEELRLHDGVWPPLDWSDPSEMIRSSRILPAIRERFEILHERPYWGNLLFPLFCSLRGSELLEPRRFPLVASWIERERELVDAGALPGPMFSVVLARQVPEISKGVRATFEYYRFRGAAADGHHEESVLRLTRVRSGEGGVSRRWRSALRGLSVRELEPAWPVFDLAGLILDDGWGIGRTRCDAEDLREAVLARFGQRIGEGVEAQGAEPGDVGVFVKKGEATRVGRVLDVRDDVLELEVAPRRGPRAAVLVPRREKAARRLTRSWGSLELYRLDPSRIEVERTFSPGL